MHVQWHTFAYCWGEWLNACAKNACVVCKARRLVGTTLSSVSHILYQKTSCYHRNRPFEWQKLAEFGQFTNSANFCHSNGRFLWCYVLEHSTLPLISTHIPRCNYLGRSTPPSIPGCRPCFRSHHTCNGQTGRPWACRGRCTRVRNSTHRTSPGMSTPASCVRSSVWTPSMACRLGAIPALPTV